MSSHYGSKVVEEGDGFDGLRVFDGGDGDGDGDGEGVVVDIGILI